MKAPISITRRRTENSEGGRKILINCRCIFRRLIYSTYKVNRRRFIESHIFPKSHQSISLTHKLKLKFVLNLHEKLSLFVISSKSIYPVLKYFKLHISIQGWFRRTLCVAYIAGGKMEKKRKVLKYMRRNRIRLKKARGMTLEIVKYLWEKPRINVM